MRSRPLVLSLSLLAALSGVAAALALQPTRSGAQAAAAPSVVGPRYQLSVLPARQATDDREWLVLDTHTGAVTHWRAEGSAYVAYSDLTPNRVGVIQARVPKQRPAASR